MRSSAVQFGFSSVQFSSVQFSSVQFSSVQFSSVQRCCSCSSRSRRMNTSALRVVVVVVVEAVVIVVIVVVVSEASLGLIWLPLVGGSRLARQHRLAHCTHQSRRVVSRKANL